MFPPAVDEIKSLFSAIPGCFHFIPPENTRKPKVGSVKVEYWPEIG